MGGPRAAAVCLTYGRAELAELVACVARQSHPLPTLVYVDNAPALEVEAPHVHVAHAPAADLSLGALRAHAVLEARRMFQLRATDAIVVLDDDDFYSADHYRLTLLALGRAEGGFTGALACGYVVDGGDPALLYSEAGPGQHATWAYRLDVYDRAGGYLDLHRSEDVSLGYAIGWANCSPHYDVTHVRRMMNASISSAPIDFDRELARRRARYELGPVRPRWSKECERLEEWCATQRRAVALSALQAPRRR